MRLTELPPEIWLRVTDYLNNDDLKQLRQASSLLRRIGERALLSELVVRPWDENFLRRLKHAARDGLMAYLSATRKLRLVLHPDHTVTNGGWIPWYDRDRHYSESGIEDTFDDAQMGFFDEDGNLQPVEEPWPWVQPLRPVYEEFVYEYLDGFLDVMPGLTAVELEISGRYGDDEAAAACIEKLRSRKNRFDVSVVALDMGYYGSSHGLILSELSGLRSLAIQGDLKRCKLKCLGQVIERSPDLESLTIRDVKLDFDEVLSRVKRLSRVKKPLDDVRELSLCVARMPRSQVNVDKISRVARVFVSAPDCDRSCKPSIGCAHIVDGEFTKFWNRHGIAPQHLQTSAVNVPFLGFLQTNRWSLVSLGVLLPWYTTALERGCCYNSPTDRVTSDEMAEKLAGRFWYDVVPTLLETLESLTVCFIQMSCRWGGPARTYYGQIIPEAAHAVENHWPPSNRPVKMWSVQCPMYYEDVLEKKYFPKSLKSLTAMACVSMDERTVDPEVWPSTTLRGIAVLVNRSHKLECVTLFLLHINANEFGEDMARARREVLEWAVPEDCTPLREGVRLILVSRYHHYGFIKDSAAHEKLRYETRVEMVSTPAGWVKLRKDEQNLAWGDEESKKEGWGNSACPEVGHDTTWCDACYPKHKYRPVFGPLKTN